MFHISRLPDELTVLLFSHVNDPSTYYSARKVSHRYNQLGKLPAALHPDLKEKITYELAQRVFHTAAFYESIPPAFQNHRIILINLLTKTPEKFLDLPAPHSLNLEMRHTALIASSFLNKRRIYDLLYQHPLPATQQCIQELQTYKNAIKLPPPHSLLWKFLPFMLYSPRIRDIQPTHFKYLIPGIRNFAYHTDLAKALVQKEATVLRLFNQHVQNDEHILQLAIRENPCAMKWASERIKKNKTFVMFLLKQNIHLELKHLDCSLYQDPDVLQELDRLKELEQRKQE